ncbi:8538_t:CDS:2, partial [Funneliformis geosporum]
MIAARKIQKASASSSLISSIGDIQLEIRHKGKRVFDRTICFSRHIR